MKRFIAAAPVLLVLVVLLLLLPLTATGQDLLQPKDGPGQHHDIGNQATQEALPAVAAPEEWVREKTGDMLPLDTFFRNEQGEAVSLRQLVDRPTLLLPVYYLCPTACSFDLANLADAVRRSSHAAGSFRVITLSFDPRETAETAALARPNYTALLPPAFPVDAWAFLTGDQDSILKVTDAIGYRFKRRDDRTFIHPSAMAVLAQDGQIIKYVYGSFIPGDVDLALAEAAKGTPATSIRRLLAFCLSADPRQNKQVFELLKAGTVLLLAAGAGFLFFFLRRKMPAPPPSGT
jgi:protein SCO1